MIVPIKNGKTNYLRCYLQRSLDQLEHGRSYIVCDFNQPRPIMAPGGGHSYANSQAIHQQNNWRYNDRRTNSQKVNKADNLEEKKFTRNLKCLNELKKLKNVNC